MVIAERTDDAEGVKADHIHPELNGGAVGWTVDFALKAFNGGKEGAGIGGDQTRMAIGQCGIGIGIQANPTDAPGTFAGGVISMGSPPGQDIGMVGMTGLPMVLQVNLPLA